MLRVLHRCKYRFSIFSFLYFLLFRGRLWLPLTATPITIPTISRVIQSNLFNNGTLLVDALEPCSYFSSIYTFALSMFPQVLFGILLNESGNLILFRCTFLPYLHRTQMTLKARMQRELRPTEINTTLAYYAVAFFSAKSICRERR